jgi:hypothetical protein
VQNVNSMWFLNDVTIKKLEHSETRVLQVCSEKNIKVRNAWHKTKWLGRIISDEDYPVLMSALANER